MAGLKQHKRSEFTRLSAQGIGIFEIENLDLFGMGYSNLEISFPQRSQR
jgi:hypothetical protein